MEVIVVENRIKKKLCEGIKKVTKSKEEEGAQITYRAAIVKYLYTRNKGNRPVLLKENILSVDQRILKWIKMNTSMLLNNQQSGKYALSDNKVLIKNQTAILPSA